MEEIPNIESSDKNEKQDKEDSLSVTEEWFEFILKNKDNKDGKTVKILEEKFNVSIPFEGQESLPMTVKMEDGQENNYTIIKNSEGGPVIKPLEVQYNESELPTDEELAVTHGMM